MSSVSDEDQLFALLYEVTNNGTKLNTLSSLGTLVKSRNPALYAKVKGSFLKNVSEMLKGRIFVTKHRDIPTIDLVGVYKGSKPPPAARPTAVPPYPSPAPGDTVSVGGAVRAAPDPAVPAEPVLADTELFWSSALVVIRQAKIIGCDLEGDLEPGGRICLWQVSTPSAVFLLDFVAAAGFPEDRRSRLFSSLKEIMEDRGVVKVFHDGRADADAAFRQLGIRISGVADTQALLLQLRELEAEAAEWSCDDAFSAVALRGDRADGAGRKPGLNEMLDAVGLPSNPFKKDVRKAMNGPGAEDLWIRHPLAAKLLGYAAADVAHLIPAREKLLERIAAAAQKLAELKSERYADEYRGADSHRLTAASRRKPWGRDLVVEMDRTAWTATYEEVAPFSEVAEGPEDEDEDEQAAASAAGPSDRKPASAPVAVSVDADLDVVLDMLPEAVRESLVAAFEAASQPLTSIMELVFDFGSQAQAYTVSPSDDPIRFGTVLTREDVAATVASMRFSSDNRAGIDRHIHRVSRIPNKEGLTVGVTIRIARVVEGVADALGDVLNEGKSVLILGRPGQGKTTLLRDICRFVSTVLRKRSMIVDTSCEIGGDGDVPHPAVGQCRRFQVRDRRNQYNIMLEAVKNHTPDVVVIDELGDRQECTSAKAISQRGVQLVATAHGSLGSVLSNPDLSGLVGGLQAVIHGDASASRLGLGKKTQVERAGRPTCDIVIELHGRTEWVVYRDVADAVDRMLAGERYGRERRWMDAATGRLMARFEMVDGRAERDEIRL